MNRTLRHGTSLQVRGAVLDRRRFLTLAGLTTPATAAPMVSTSLGSGGEAMARSNTRVCCA